jgi:hypothetical protein
MSANANS